MGKNERINSEQEMPAEANKDHSADADRVKEVYKVTIAGSIINVVLLVLKFAAGILGHSAAMIADAIHSLTDFATDVVVLVFVKLGNKPKDKDHDYGHGKYETLATAIIGISLFLLFITLGIPQGYTTVVLSHITFCLPYVILSVMPRLKQMNPNLYEAALDLGASPMQALRKVIIPEILPGMISGFMLAITMSIDDFAVTIFTIGNEGLETLSTFIYADARKGGLTPELRPLSTIIFVLVLVMLIIINRRSDKNKKK